MRLSRTPLQAFQKLAATLVRALQPWRDMLRKHAVTAQAILAITDNWQGVGGADQYVKWCGGSGHNDFFTNSNCMQLYKNFASTLINRVNTINGRV